MRIAIVILNWNGIKLLEKFLPSVVKHSENHTIYVIDNNSDDKSIDFITNNFPDVKIIKNEINYGYAKGYNKGLKHVKEEIYLQLERSIKSTLIRVDNPNESFSKLLDHFGKSEVNLKGIDKNSHIDKSVSFHDDLFFGAFSVCKSKSKIGKNVKIYAQVYIGENVFVGDNTIIYPGVKFIPIQLLGKIVLYIQEQLLAPMVLVLIWIMKVVRLK